MSETPIFKAKRGDLALCQFTRGGGYEIHRTGNGPAEYRSIPKETRWAFAVVTNVTRDGLCKRAERPYPGWPGVFGVVLPGETRLIAGAATLAPLTALGIAAALAARDFADVASAKAAARDLIDAAKSRQPATTEG